ncbi:Trp biosynthesis-associated membrane protein [Frigoribacterium sp. VKM Ac-2836]|uniref:Trp biosynthesis-associated membrane protein n=1 Tax=Frigoribacterium sp. VKM Ac-2836 TaxID=2739014 RepID=UPI0015669491|nr:Trp biosynthesis-associated membrane protein [Frigoribacterium sp. VKM Ac-2836]NRD25982.1 Trp biosynthesis-associated membrane protein [Frigoribacterium sp. VKM Ac-2836]
MTARRLKLTTILTGIVLAGLGLLSWTQDWFHVVVASPQGGELSLDVAGDVAGAPLSALSLASLALFGALTIAGRVFRVVLGVLQVALGASVVLTTSTALADPVRASGSAVTTATGVDGTDSIRSIVSSVEPTAWPWLGLAAGVLAALLGIATVLLSGAWPRATRKYSATRLVVADPSADPAAAWDALSSGDDPTDTSPRLDEGGSGPTEQDRTG